MRIEIKRRVRLSLQESANLAPFEAEIRLYPTAFGWEARIFAEERPLMRRFRSEMASVALGKMIVWIKRKYHGAEIFLESPRKGDKSIQLNQIGGNHDG